uniref:Putative ATP-binding cassette transporter n=1 Tax=Candidatus Kentrum sp. FW TaxID=2126338 RepID=A0A450SY68_9GAMM|nr:MAG: putative ATP-binding cassette transporter [Candidatus Kentron sp. FW]VFJ58921.1 MAG: putative ATP-binding cassette transporter [Candidatus Kentron sp. FW]VFJ63132.1 MAG: putative ATP-binding cassette transporter [Candidatus Kentron sp. FW]
MLLQLLRFFREEAVGPKLLIFGTSLASGLSRGLLLAVINAAAEQTMAGRTSHWHGLLFLLLLSFYLGSDYYGRVRISRMVEGMIQRLRLRICDKLLYVELSFIEGRDKGELYTRLVHDINAVSGLTPTLLGAFQGAMLLAFSLIYIGWLSPVGMVMTIVAVVAGAGIYLLRNKSAIADFHRLAVKQAEFFGSIDAILGGFKELKISRAKRNDIMADTADISHEYRELKVKREQIFAVDFLTSQLSMFGLIAIVVFVLPLLFSSELPYRDTTVIFQLLAAILFLIGPLEVVVSSIPSITQSKVSMDNIQGLERDLDAAIAEQENRAANVVPMGFDTIKLDELSFRYDSPQGSDTFEVGPITLDIRRGEVLFIVGGNGSGKTTLLKLLTGLYLPVSGAIRVNGNTVENKDYQAYREMFTTIFSDFYLFSRLYGIDDIDGNEMHDLLRRFGLDKKTRYRDGGFTSINLSTGQRKRLAYISCYLEDRRIYVFDELAADQDPVFRQFFYDTLLPELKAAGKTIIAITHDDHYFHACDRLIKMDYGQIEKS